MNFLSAVTVFSLSVDSREKWPHRYDAEEVTVTRRATDLSVQENVHLKDLLKMRDKLRMHEQLRMQEQLNMQKELLHKQQLWMQQQLRKQGFLGMPEEEIKSEDTFRFTHMLEEDPITEETLSSSEKGVQQEDTTETREAQSKEKYINKLTETVDTTTENIFNTLSSQIVDYVKTPVPHQIKYNVQIQIFTLKILEIGTQVFDGMSNKTDDVAVKKKLEELSSIYALKYKEFLNETYKHNIKTRLGTQKVVLDAIDVSDRILKRLFNEIVIDLDKKGCLRENIGTMNDLQKEVRKGADQQYQLLCSKLNVCRTNNGFPEFLNDFFTTILRCDDVKFRRAIDALTEVAKDVDFSNVFHKKTRKQIKRLIDHVEKQDLNVLRPSLLIIRNIIANKNRPIVFKPSDAENSRVNSTIALLEILDAFETKLPRSDANILEWGDLRTCLYEWEKENRNDVQDIMGIFMRHIKGALDGMPNSMQEHIANNFGRFIKSH